MVNSLAHYKFVYDAVLYALEGIVAKAILERKRANAEEKENSTLKSTDDDSDIIRGSEEMNGEDDKQTPDQKGVKNAILMLIYLISYCLKMTKVKTWINLLRKENLRDLRQC